MSYNHFFFENKEYNFEPMSTLEEPYNFIALSTKGYTLDIRGTHHAAKNITETAHYSVLLISTGQQGCHATAIQQVSISSSVELLTAFH